MSIGERIRSERKKIYLTQKEPSDITGIPVTTISDYEKNKYEPNATNILKISTALKCSIGWLVSGKIENVKISIKELNMIRMFEDLDERDKEDILDILKMKHKKIKNNL